MMCGCGAASHDVVTRCAGKHAFSPWLPLVQPSRSLCALRPPSRRLLSLQISSLAHVSPTSPHPTQASTHSYRLLSLKANAKFESIDGDDTAPLNVRRT